MRGLGWKRDPLDIRDGKHAFSTIRDSLAATVPLLERASVRERVVKMLNQGGAGTCVACAGMQAIRVAHVGALLALTGSLELARQSSELGSILWGYFFARVPDHSTGYDSGCNLRSFFAAMGKLGLPPETLWPYSDSRVPGARMFTFPSKSVFRAAYDQHCLNGYHRIDAVGSERKVDVMLAIAAGKAVAAGWDVSQRFVDDAPDGIVLPLQPGEQIAGGHAMLMVGYEPECLTICNSWGEGWGSDGGFFKADWSWLDQAEDLWVVDSSPLFSEETP